MDCGKSLSSVAEIWYICEDIGNCSMVMGCVCVCVCVCVRAHVYTSQAHRQVQVDLVDRLSTSTGLPALDKVICWAGKCDFFLSFFLFFFFF